MDPTDNRTLSEKLGDIAWKGKVERYFISRAPILREILMWAEKQDMEEITAGKFQKIVGERLTPEQVAMTKAAIWGFLSNTTWIGLEDRTFEKPARR